MTGVSSASSSVIRVFFLGGLVEDDGEGVERISGELIAPSLTDLDLSRVFCRNLGNLELGAGEGVWRECLLDMVCIQKQRIVVGEQG